MPRPLDPFLARCQAWLDATDFHSAGKWIGLSTLIGLAGGLAAVLFHWILELVHEYGPPLVTGVEEEGLGGLGHDTWSHTPWLALLVLPIGGLLVGWLTTRYSPESRGGGTSRVVDTFHNHAGKVRPLEPLVKGLTAAITIGSGGSAGQEGPIAQVGAGLGSRISEWLGLTDRDRRIFLLAGSSAGIGALFTAPLGAALFAPEALYKKPEFEGEAIVPCIISSIIAYTTFRTVTGRERALDLPASVLDNLALEHPSQLAVYLALALACAFVGWFYVRILQRTREAFRAKSPIPMWLRPAIGGLLLGLLAVAIAPWCGDQGVLYGGYELMHGAVEGRIAFDVMLILIAAKIFATSFTVGSGGSGGVFAPSLAIGALLGSVVGNIGATYMPDLGISTSAVALVGMGGFFSGVTKTPIASILIVSEMTGGYELLAPLMLVSVLHLLFSRRWSLFETQVASMVESPAHTGDFVVDILARMKVRELLDGARRPVLVPEETTLRKALELVSTSAGYYFPVVDKNEALVGIFSLSDVRRIFHEMEVADFVIVRDFMMEDVVTTGPDATLSEAHGLLNEYGLHELPVVATDDPSRVLAMLSRNNLGAAYHRRMHSLRRVKPQDS